LFVFNMHFSDNLAEFNPKKYTFGYEQENVLFTNLRSFNDKTSVLTFWEENFIHSGGVLTPRCKLDKQSSRAYAESLYDHCFPLNLSIVCVDTTNNEIVGVSFGYDLADCPKLPDVLFKNETFKYMVELEDEALEFYTKSDLCKEHQAKNIKCRTSQKVVLKEYRSKGIGNTLSLVGWSVALDAGYEWGIDVVSSRYIIKMAEEATPYVDFAQLLGKINYSQWVPKHQRTTKPHNQQPPFSSVPPALYCITVAWELTNSVIAVAARQDFRSKL